MQLCQFEKTYKICDSKFYCFHKQTKQNYILTIQAPSQFNYQLYELHHKNLLLIDQFWEEKGQVCLIQKCDNLNNFQKFIQNNRFSENAIMIIIHYLLSAMFYLEQQQIPISISLNNVYMDEKMNVQIDVLNIINAQVEFSSPEVLRKERQSSGIWSVGCFAYYLMRKELPFQGNNERTTTYNVLYKDLPSYNFQDFPLISKILKVIFVKNLKRRVMTKQVLQFLDSQISQIEEPIDSINNQQFCLTKKYKSSTLLSKIDKFDYSDKQSESLRYEDKQSTTNKLITLQELEDQQSKFRIRPQPYIFNASNDIINKIKIMRPNSAISTSGKEFVRMNLKEELNQKRFVQGQHYFPNRCKEQKHHKEISIDVDDASKLKHCDTIRVYNLENQDNNYYSNKSTRVYKKIVKPKQMISNEIVQQQLHKLQNWRNKILIN